LRESVNSYFFRIGSHFLDFSLFEFESYFNLRRIAILCLKPPTDIKLMLRNFKWKILHCFFHILPHFPAWNFEKPTNHAMFIKMIFLYNSISNVLLCFRENDKHFMSSCSFNAKKRANMCISLYCAKRPYKCPKQILKSTANCGLHIGKAFHKNVKYWIELEENCIWRYWQRKVGKEDKYIYLGTGIIFNFP
jgi:hypothetical protein